MERYAADSDQASSPRTIEGYVYSLSSLVRFGVVYVDELTRENVVAWCDARRDRGLSTKTLNRGTSAVSALAGWLERRGQFPLARLLELKRLHRRVRAPATPRFLTEAECGRLLAAARAVRPALGLLVSLVLNSGLRANEARQLHHEDLELHVEEPFLRVRRSLGRETKTYKERVVPVTRSFAEELKAQGVGAPKTGPIFAANMNGRGRGPKGFPSTQPYIALPTIERWLLAAKAAAGLPDATLIVCRHTFASRHAQNGVSLLKIAAWCGHSPQVCASYYVALAPGGDRDVEKTKAIALPAPIAGESPMAIAKEHKNLETASKLEKLLEETKAIVLEQKSESKIEPLDAAPKNEAPWRRAIAPGWLAKVKRTLDRRARP